MQSEDTTPELGGDLVTAGNRITHAASGTVSFLDFTKTLFSETNHTVLSSVKSIDLFLDSNGGDAGQAFRIYNNTNPDGTVTENTHIFKVAESGDVSVGNDISVAGNATITGDLTVSEQLQQLIQMNLILVTILLHLMLMKQEHQRKTLVLKLNVVQVQT